MENKKINQNLEAQAQAILYKCFIFTKLIHQENNVIHPESNEFIF